MRGRGGVSGLRRFYLWVRTDEGGVSKKIYTELHTQNKFLMMTSTLAYLYRGVQMIRFKNENVIIFRVRVHARVRVRVRVRVMVKVRVVADHLKHR
jgi:hypothetical protein